MFDKDGSGGISIGELQENFGTEGATEEIWKEIVGEVDDNNDGEISYNEFKDMMLKLLDERKEDMEALQLK
jgi:calcium-dependent protein kinase